MRSKLFVPASRPELYGKALQSAADSISFDLEDAVRPELRSQARQTLRQFFNETKIPPHKTIIVRINPLSCEDGMQDLQQITCSAIHIINLPKVEDTQ